MTRRIIPYITVCILLLFNRIEGSTLYVSSIFKWYSEDFNNDIAGFFMKYAEGEIEERLQKKAKEIKVEYLDYDWSLNDK